MRRYKRRLPHWDIVEQPLFVTFRLHGSLPANRVFPPAGLVSAGKAFVAVDRLLDASANGPLFLRRPEIAEMVVAALRHGDCALHRYQLHSFVVMPNHVHLLATPHVLATKWLGPLKGFTAHQANPPGNSWTILAGGKLRPSGPIRYGVRPYPGLYRRESSEGGARIQARAVSLVECKWSRLKGDCGQDCPPSKGSVALEFLGHSHDLCS